ncbi:SDR family oxidoreductase [Kosakonia sacchari]|uniref:SDR family oxidoreductase n=1 Tax=Kosakonia sacchari TaxID=1158459 RepID=UPI000BE5C7EA|nr:SDR family oxidoreductase [Kosakonia sacchari]PDO81965.1 SDR family oxidoreductase [Kosakonia sacchari]
MKKQSILIIGAEKGLGHGLTAAYLERGWDVFATHLPDADTSALRALADVCPGNLMTGEIDVTNSAHIGPLLDRLRERQFDVIFMVAGIYGPLHQSVLQASDAEFQQIMLTNAFGPARLARHLLPVLKPAGSLVFMSSHRGSIASNTEPGIGLELYRASKAALNMLARCIYRDISQGEQTVLSIHPGWVATAMGTLDGTVDAEIDVKTSVNGMISVIEQHRNARSHLFLDYENNSWPW